MYKCEHFKIHELVDPATYDKFGQGAWKFFDSRLLKGIDDLRKTFGSCTINSWKWGGQYKWSGYRSPACKIGAKNSLHRLWRAFDCKFKDMTAAEIRGFIRKDPIYWGKYFSRIENGVNWLHIDSANDTGSGHIKFFNP